MSGSNLQTLSEIYNDRLFRIPDYQRGYSWEDEQLTDFWRDLNNLDDIRTHYTGMITVEHKKENNNYHIIDGQQRLTTIMILLQVILEEFNDDEWIGDDEFGKTKSRLVEQFLYKRTGKDGYKINPIFGYDKDNPSDIYYRTKILSLENSDIHNVATDTLYTKNLNYTKEFFTKKIESLDKNNLEVLVRKITKQLKFNFYEIDKSDGLDEYIIFETMNNRGKSLTTLELLKNRLIYLTTLLKNEDDEIEELRKNINDVWKTIYGYLGKKSQHKIEDDKFLKDHWIMYFGEYDRKIANPEKDFLLKEHFTIQKVLFKDSDKHKEFIELSNEFSFPKEKVRAQYIDYSDIQNYIYNIKNAVVAYYNMLNPLQTDYTDKVKKWLSKINRLGFDTFKPLLMSVLINIEKIEEHQLVKLLKLIENYMFIKFKTMRGSRTTINEFFKLSYAYHKNKDIYVLLEKLDSFVYDNHRNKLFKFNNFRDIIYINFDEKEGWYSWNGLQYLLYEYELYLQEKIKGENKLLWKDSGEKSVKDTIEHIYPQNTKRECWDEFNNLDRESRNLILHSLGNLVLLSKSYNSMLGNSCFEDKKEIFSSASYSTIQISQNDKWTQESILKRGSDILNFMSLRWNIAIPNEEIAKLLH